MKKRLFMYAFGLLLLAAAGCTGGYGGKLRPTVSPGATFADPIIPRVAMDGFGTGVVVWHEELVGMFARTFDGPTRTWGADEPLPLRGSQMISIAMTGSVVHVAWSNLGVSATRFDTTTGWDSAPPDPLDLGLDSAGDVQLDRNLFGTSGTVVGVWRLVRTKPPGIPYAAAYAGRVLPGGAWPAFPDRLDTNPQQQTNPKTVFHLRVAADGLGRSMAVWEQEVGPPIGTIAIFSSRFNGQRWTDPVRIDESTDPRTGSAVIGLDAAGNGLIVYQHDGTIRAARYDANGGAWDPPVELAQIGGNPRIAVNGAGVAVAAWGSGVLNANRYVPGIGWGTSQAINMKANGSSVSGPTTGALEVAVDAAGRARVVWVGVTKIHTAAYDPQIGGWEPVEDLGPGRYPDLAMDGSGRAIACWYVEGQHTVETRVWEPPAPPSPSSPLGVVAFASDRTTNDFNIYSMKPDGSDVRQHTTDAAADTDPEISPDGTEICFVSDRDADSAFPNATDIYVVTVANRTVRRLTRFNADGVTTRDPAWRPDGGIVAVAVSGLGFGGIFLINPADGNTIRQLTSDPDDRHPSWNGTEIAFDRNGDLLTVDTAVPGPLVPTVLTNRAEFDEDPAWSPDGRFILFTATTGLSVYTVSSGQIVTRTGFAGDRHAAWSPDGSRILFVQDNNGSPVIWNMNPDGTGAAVIPGQQAGNNRPHWR